MGIIFFLVYVMHITKTRGSALKMHAQREALMKLCRVINSSRLLCLVLLSPPLFFVFFVDECAYEQKFKSNNDSVYIHRWSCPLKRFCFRSDTHGRSSTCTNSNKRLLQLTESTNLSPRCRGKWSTEKPIMFACYAPFTRCQLRNGKVIDLEEHYSSLVCGLVL